MMEKLLSINPDRRCGVASIELQAKVDRMSFPTFSPKEFEEINFCVYRYIDVNDGQIKYIGICNNGTLPGRHRGHMNDDWFKRGEYVCEYIKLRNQTETEAMESHLISIYGTDKFYNKAKAGWGEASFIDTPLETEWKIAPWYDYEHFKKNAIESLQSDWLASATDALRTAMMVKDAVQKYRVVKRALVNEDANKRPERYGLCREQRHEP